MRRSGGLSRPQRSQKNAPPAAESAWDAPPLPQAQPASWFCIRLLCSWLGCITGRTPGRETVRRLVKRLGYSWKKAKKLLGKACPERRAQFVQQLGELLTEAQQDQGPLVVFADEAHLHLDTDLGWGWAPRGQRLYVNSTSPPLARKLTCFGFYALGATEPVRLWTTHWANAETTCQALLALRERYPDRPLVLIWDNVRYHHALLVRRCAEELAIQLRYLPPYSPDLMPVERLWHWLRQQLTALHCHRDEQELRDRVAGFEAQVNDDPRAVHCRLRPKTRLDPEEEKLRV